MSSSEAGGLILGILTCAAPSPSSPRFAMGAYSAFVVDEEPSPSKPQAGSSVSSRCRASVDDGEEETPVSSGAFFYPKMFCAILSGTIFSDIETGIGLKRKQLIAIALLARNNHDLHGVPGFEIDAAVRFVKLYSNDETLDPFSLIGKGIQI